MRPGGLLSLCVVVIGCGRIGFGLYAGSGAPPSDGTAPGDTDTGVSPPSCPAFALLCDDFETGVLIPKWTRVDTALGGTATITATRPHFGSLSLEVDCPTQAMDDAQGAPTLRFPPQTSGVLAVREWINPSVPIVHFDLVAQVQTQSPFQYSSAGGNDLGMWVSTELGPPGNMGSDHTSTTATPAPGTWSCLELVYTFAGGGGNARIQLFLDEALILDQPANDVSTATYNEMAVGVVRADHAGFHVFVDDVVIAKQRIHCN